MAGALSFRWAIGFGGSTECSPPPAADARSAATAAGRGPQASALHTPPHRQGPRGAPLHRRQGDGHTWPAQESGAQEVSAALPAGAPGRNDTCRLKKLVRFERVGHRITGDRCQGCSPGAGYEKVHVAIDDATRLANVEVLADEQKATTVGFLARAVGWFSEQGIASGFFRITATTTLLLHPKLHACHSGAALYCLPSRRKNLNE